MLIPEIVLTLPEPHPGQAKVLADPARYVVLMCGRRWGKTTLGILDAASVVLGQGRDWEGRPFGKPRPYGWFAPTYKILAAAWRDCERILKPVIRHVDATEKRITLVTGEAIEFWSMDGDDPARGRKYGAVFVDEGGMVPGLLTTWSAAIRPTLTDYRGRATFGGTPKGMGTIAELYQRGAQGKDGWAAYQCPSTDNIHIPGIAEEVQQAKGDMPLALWEQEYLGKPMGDAGNPFGESHIQACVAPLSAADPVVFGVDVAVEHDYTVIVGLDDRGCVCRFDRFNGCDWDAAEQRIIAAVGRVPTIIDATGVGAPIAQRLAKVNPHTKPFKFTSNSKQQIMAELARAIQAGEVRYPDGPIANELRTFQYAYKRSGTVVHVRYTAPDGLYDDCVCALALAVSGFASRPETTIWINGKRYAA